ncbi:MAG: tRNA (adenosine(37)-N6)-threonylcarbamoyltransferase complex transferase subunit TsaD [Candidatus Vogelbacteria bacterium CG10_big_fil_rev_8_21_14_0_10_45_14]|uniref:tRNA N6-adenosine threonylcarbamoyltransferase n=1 Tax=Candidatus Vogelbacteria bacterium CG10_big_fil_rev_8_21_14_0_10_45_14 TaxID=1975042 RepID=A0A2H0RKH5_9BACT|nr:MAG: tRNA (adenosine(37)-N6)-threonylcarbamoyltransferase complex transferase subunit TsaD [Candidatus Vogelbacteria bacterium CG10_big_fil_rev_8_21_14_0_10_45_14]
MIILGIETSCDETAVAVVECAGSFEDLSLKVISSVVSSQIAKHAPYGGVVPNIAKREHQENLVTVLAQALHEAGILKDGSTNVRDGLREILSREEILMVHLENFLEKHAVPDIDAVAVTQGPGLEPALWVGLNFGKALSHVWGKPLIPVNHMLGHVVSPLLDDGSGRKIPKVVFPAVSLLVSGGHTELVLIHDWKKYELLGATRDDAVGEAFDKVARVLGLPYPGGPEITKAAEKGEPDERVSLPRPMLNSGDLDFSYSGLKTAVMYLVKSLGADIDAQTKANIALEFERAATEVLISKTLSALEQKSAKSLVVGGGVAANKRLRNDLKDAMDNNYPEVVLLLPDPKATGDNAAMIAAAGYLHADEPMIDTVSLTADGNLRLSGRAKENIY